jgi:hypothetical protein
MKVEFAKKDNKRHESPVTVLAAENGRAAAAISCF